MRSGAPRTEPDPYQAEARGHQDELVPVRPRHRGQDEARLDQPQGRACEHDRQMGGDHEDPDVGEDHRDHHPERDRDERERHRCSHDGARDRRGHRIEEGGSGLDAAAGEEEAVRLYRAGISIRAIARRMGVGCKSVRTALLLYRWRDRCLVATLRPRYEPGRLTRSG